MRLQALRSYAAIRFALAQLGDRHSFLQLTPALMREETSRKPAPTQTNPPSLSTFQMRRSPEGSIIQTAGHSIARILVPGFSGQDADGFATKLQAIVGELASKGPCGWIVDLRGNGGGNMWPMLAGVGPILGEAA